jgi:hypothetical protein
MCISPYLSTTTLSLLLLHCIITLFLHLLSTNHKCTQPCYFPLVYKPIAQKVKMVMKNSSMRSSRLSAARLLFLWRCGVFHCSVPQESCLSL